VTLAITFGAYGAGALIGVLVHRSGPRLRHAWPVYLRAQLVATAALLGLFSAWRLTAAHQIVDPLVLAAVGWLLLGVAVWVRGPRSHGMAALEGWAAFPNGAFWVQPLAAALLGPGGSLISALTNAAYAASNAASIHLLRRDAPIRQRRATSWIDQSMLVAVAVGLLLHLAGPAPAGSRWVLIVSGPVLAFVGAGLYMGSVFHPHNVSVVSDAHDVWRWLLLTSVRIAFLLVVAAVTRSTAVAVIAVLSALGPPAFNPPQLAVLYGYRSGVVVVAARWGWMFLPVGLVVALLIR
jgi:hypothetical protein